MGRLTRCRCLQFGLLLAGILTAGRVTPADAQQDVWLKLLSQADVQHSAGADDSAIYYAGRALMAAQVLHGRADTSDAMILHRIGVYFTNHNLDSAELYYGRALAIWDSNSSSNPQLVARTLNNLGAVVRRDGRYSLSEKYLLRALELKRRNLPSDHIEISNALNSLGNLYKDMGEYARAEKFYVDALDIRRRTLSGSDFRIGAVLNNLGVLYISQGRYEDAVASLSEALAQQRAREDKGLFIAWGQNYAEALFQLGRLQAADSFFSALTTMLERIPSDSAVWLFNETRSDVSVNYAAVKRIEGEFAAADSLLSLAQRQADTYLPEDSPGRARIVFARALLAQARKDFPRALSEFRSAAEARARILGPQHPDVQDTYMEIASTFMAMDLPDSALAPAEKAADLACRNYYLLAVTLPDREALASAQRLEAALQVSLLAWEGSHDRDSKDVAPLCALALRIKGMTTNLLLQRRRIIARSDDPAIRVLRDRHRYAAGTLAGRFLTGAGADTAAYHREVDSLYRDLERLTNEIALEESVSYFNNTDQPTTPDSLARHLSPDELIIDYLVAPDLNHPKLNHYYALLIDTERTALMALASPGRIDSLVERYREHMTRLGESDHFPTLDDLREYRRIAADLTEDLLTPLKPYMMGKRRLCISPAGALNLVSFAGLLDGNGNFLGRSCSIRMFDNLRELDHFTSAQHGADSVGLFAIADPDPDSAWMSDTQPSGVNADTADRISMRSPVRAGCLLSLDSAFQSLPGAREEVAGIRQHWEKGDGSTLTYVGTRATEHALRLHAPGCRVLHLATHAYFLEGDCTSDPQAQSEEDPVSVSQVPLLNAGLLLAGARTTLRKHNRTSDDDGILTALEVAELNLHNVELVTLSTCESARGAVYALDGVYGLRRAFQFAGVGAVVASLWRVPDVTTAELMSGLYSHSEGTFSERLREAELATLDRLRAQGLVDHPFLWAGFVAYGR